MKVLWDLIRNEKTYLILTLAVLVYGVYQTMDEIDLMRDEINLTRDEIKVRQRPFFGLTRPEVRFFDEDPDVKKHEILFIMNFENKGPIPANSVKIDQALFFVKEDLEIGEKPEGQLFRNYKAEGISILPNQMYPIHYMENLKTLKDKLFKEYGEPTKPGYLYIHTYLKYYGIKKEPQYFQETVYLFEWAPAYSKEGVFHLYLSKSN